MPFEDPLEGPQVPDSHGEGNALDRVIRPLHQFRSAADANGGDPGSALNAVLPMEEGGEILLFQAGDPGQPLDWQMLG